jgi:ABC-type transport system involved in multi-copper enzyme maturation permease subunit
MISPILWKEWREQRWKLAFGTLMLVFFTCSFLAAGITSDQEMAVVIWLFGGLILALHSAMGVFAPERANGTMSFLASKPIEPWKVFACKWLFGWLNVAGPMLACALVLILFRPGDTATTGLRTQMVILVMRVAIVGLGLATMFYTMTCCLAPRRVGEAAVGLVGLLVFVALMLHMVVAGSMVMEPMYRDNVEPSLLGKVLLFVNPLTWIIFAKPFNPKFNFPIMMILVQMILFVLVVWIGLRKWQRSV